MKNLGTKAKLLSRRKRERFTGSVLVMHCCCLALEKLGVSKEEAVMIGDNSHDIEGGKNAGVRTAGVAWSAKGESYLQQFNPDYMLHHMSDLIEIVKGD